MSSSSATWEQARRFLELVATKGTPQEQIDALFQSGLLSDLLDANIDIVNRNEFRALIGLRTLDSKQIVEKKAAAPL